MIDLDRLPPHDIEAERGTLASMMLAPDAATFAAIRRAIGTPDAMYQPDHRTVFNALCWLNDHHKPIDALALRDILVRSRQLEDVGGTAFIAALLGAVPSAAHGPHYAAIVREKYLLRSAIVAATNAIRRSYEAHKGDHAIEILQACARDMASLAATGVADKVHLLGDVMAEVYESLDAKEPPRLPTKLRDFDELCGGIPYGQFTMFAGRPGMGKSQIIKQILLNAALAGIPAGLVTIEENRHKVATNMLANASTIDNNRIAYHTVAAEEYTALAAGLNKYARAPFFITDEPVKLGDVEAAITMLALEKKCRVIAVDYLQLVDTEGDTENREITVTSRTLKRAFKRLAVAGMACVQLNRGNETQGRRPTLRDMRGSGSLEQDGDLIVLLHREDYYNRGKEGYFPDHKLEADVAKNKDGQTGVLPLWFSGKYQAISDWNNGYGPAAGATEAA